MIDLGIVPTTTKVKQLLVPEVLAVSNLLCPITYGLEHLKLEVAVGHYGCANWFEFDAGLHKGGGWLLRRMRADMLAIGVVLLATATSGCYPFVPTRPDESGPVSLTMIDGHFAYYTCFAESIEVNDINITVAVSEDGHRREYPLLSAANDDGGIITLPRFSIITAANPPAGIHVLHQNPFDASSFDDAELTAYISLAGPEGRVAMAFEEIDTDALRAGQYQHGSGAVNREPCGDAGSE